MKKRVRSFPFVTALFLLSIGVLMMLACGGSSEEEEKTGTGGADGAADESTESNDNQSTTTSTSDGGGGSAPTNSTSDTTSSTTQSKVKEGDQCKASASIGPLFSLFSATGICQKPSADCVGGTPDKFDISSAVDLSTVIPEDLFGGAAIDLGSILQLSSDAANCEEGLVCCIDTTQCDSVGQQLKGVLGEFIPDMNISCKASDSCPAGASQQAVGCEEGKLCCIDITIPDLNDILDGGAPNGE